jgi:hypothetical protein
LQNGGWVLLRKWIAKFKFIAFIEFDC